MILLTGASGFLGNYIYDYLTPNYKIDTLGLTDTDNYKCDLSKGIPSLNSQYKIVIHCAGKAHCTPKSKEETESLFNLNLKGTQNLCEALKINKLPTAFIYISSVAVYGKEYGQNINETHPLNGLTPYALSKIRTEEYLAKWCKENGIVLGILRPSLIAGKNPPGNLGVMIDAIKKRKYFSIGKGTARKSMVLAEDIAKIIPDLAQTGGVYNICADYDPTFKEIENLITNQLKVRKVKSIPYLMALLLGYIGDLLGSSFPINSKKVKKITNSLTFSNEKIKRDLGWKPLKILDHFKIS